MIPGIYPKLFTGQWLLCSAQTFIRDIASDEDEAFYATLEYPRWPADGAMVIGALHVDQRFPGDVATALEA